MLAALAVVLDGFDVQIIAFAAPALMQDWGIDRSQLAPIFAIGFIGMMIGTFIGGWLGDRIGRRGGILSSVLLFALCTGAVVLAQNLVQLGVLRFVAALGLGALIPNATSLIAEFTPRRHRSVAVAIGLVCNPIGGVIGGLFAAPLLPEIGWRGLFALGGLVPLAMFAILYVYLLESPRYLRRAPKHRDRLDRTLARMGIEVPPGAEIVDSAEVSTAAQASIAELFRSEFRRDTVALAIGFFSVMAALYGALSWTPTLLAGRGFDLSQSSLGLLLVNAGGVIGSIAAGWLIGRRGSARITPIIAFTGALTSAALAFIPLSPANWPFIAFALFVFGLFVLSGAACLFAIASQAYPVQLRGTGVGFAVGWGRLGATLAALAGAPLIGLGGSAFFATIAAAMIVTMIGFLSLRRHVPRREGADPAH
jgi:AAHS family 4-hydroxybenzoate transporter-like MFS transporter